MISSETLQIVIAGISTLGIYSFLYRENLCYRTFEHLFIGIATAWGLVVTFSDFLWPKVFKTMLGLDILYLPDGTPISEHQTYYYLYIIPILFSLLYYTIYSPKYRHLAQLVISFQLGCAGGLAFKGTFVELMPQIYDSFRPLYFSTGMSNQELFLSLGNTIFLVTLICSFLYFFFTFRSSDGGTLYRLSAIGRYLMMACFGAIFGSTMMARMALLVERIVFLTEDWMPALVEVFGGIFV